MKFLLAGTLCAMKKRLQKNAYLLIGLLCLPLSGCSIFHMYRPDIEQGNVITQGMITQLKAGMTTDQVQYIMGAPVLSSTFDPNRWDYVYTFRHGSQPRQQQHAILYFNNGILQKIETSPLETVK